LEGFAAVTPHSRCSQLFRRQQFRDGRKLPGAFLGCGSILGKQLIVVLEYDFLLVRPLFEPSQVILDFILG
jgi:hypothetical protein